MKIPVLDYFVPIEQVRSDMHSDFCDAELIEDREDVAGFCDILQYAGDPVSCHRCRDEERPITAIFILHDQQKAWALCDECVRGLPAHGILV